MTSKHLANSTVVENQSQLSFWQDRRRQLNHDWLKNQYVQALGKWRRLLNGEIEDPWFESRFISDVMPEWETRRVEILELLNDFELHMSPRRLFECQPLISCRPETKLWLGGLVHALWLARHPVQEWVETACRKVAEANIEYLELQQLLANCEDTASSIEFKRLHMQFNQFHKACIAVARAIEMLPSRISV